MENHGVQGVLKQYLPEVLAASKFPVYQLKALDQLSVCRTSALGGHAQYCEQGHLNGVWYNSCKHRACPQCRSKAGEEWLRNTQSLLLDCPHHHVIFTIPSELNVLWRYNRAHMTDLLFRSVRETLKQFSRDKRYLGATPGLLCVLHTWGRDLCLHPHIHVLISHGGLDSSGNWIKPLKKQLFPQKPVMMVFRGILLRLLGDSLSASALRLPPDHVPQRVEAELRALLRKSWVVHFCERYDHAQGVARYLARYVKGSPYRNSQIRLTGSGRVSFQYKSHRTQQVEAMSLSASDFIKRILNHVPVPRKPSIRYGGLYSSGGRRKLNIARDLLGQEAVSERQHLQWTAYLEDRGIRPVCKRCGLALFQREAVDRKK